ncbi:lysine--tRNA ligase [Bacillus pacificus]|uniref:lysine--tRNA ligase n=1 Tax=Bacillus pacificus TaxID=2026187 RepID=UPI0006654FF8|nr:lysine--tRNA ligase [Bacillus cereus]KXY88444.1 lysine--tRNA ligase [Bacillus cereus]MBL3794514.1 lysine--tRNA ligase [Bacillus cereus]MBL3858669.1 lysine--tRNA ligase [Bacillus cereus]HDR7969428.1 lysine--tRNA ligase [Bacillus pacificus]
MHWAYEVAHELIRKHPNKETFVCASGISPSGSVHIGNFREIVTTYFVVRALQDLGKKTRFIFSWDDYDRFRKVPKNVDSSFVKYIGMPYCDIPDPYGCHNSYAEHFEKEFEESLQVFGVEVEFIYQHAEYRSGRYNKNILEALYKRKEIYDILMSFKTGECSEEEREGFYSVTLYCEKCGKDATTITHFDEVLKTVRYECECGNQTELSVLNTNEMKPNWKIDWPMRWMIEDVVFEPGGRDHSSETGSYNVSKEIARKIFNREAPHYIAYDFIGIKGHHEKMSSSSGNSITPSELLKVYLPEVILFMFAKYRPDAAFHIGLDEDVIRNYTEYERLKDSYKNKTLKNEDLFDAIKLSKVDSQFKEYPRFNQVAGTLPLLNFDSSILQGTLDEIDRSYALDAMIAISNRAEYWVRNFQSEKLIAVNQERNTEFYNTLNERQKERLVEVCNILCSNKDYSNLMEQLYALCHHENKKIMKENQKQLFIIIYRLIMNQSSGPRIPLLIHVVGIEKFIELLDF